MYDGSDLKETMSYELLKEKILGIKITDVLQRKNSKYIGEKKCSKSFLVIHINL